jgi:hypothetical protein
MCSTKSLLCPTRRDRRFVRKFTRRQPVNEDARRQFAVERSDLDVAAFQELSLSAACLKYKVALDERSRREL